MIKGKLMKSELKINWVELARKRVKYEKRN
jgi:hypothetical protein